MQEDGLSNGRGHTGYGSDAGGLNGFDFAPGVRKSNTPRSRAPATRLVIAVIVLGKTNDVLAGDFFFFAVRANGRRRNSIIRIRTSRRGLASTTSATRSTRIRWPRFSLGFPPLSVSHDHPTALASVERARLSTTFFAAAAGRVHRSVFSGHVADPMLAVRGGLGTSGKRATVPGPDFDRNLDCAHYGFIFVRERCSSNRARR